MGFNVNLNLDKLPHIWQTAIAMVMGGSLIGGSLLFVGKKLEANSYQQQEVKQAVIDINTRLKGVESTQEKIMHSMDSQRLLIKDNNNRLSKEIDQVEGRLIYYIRHSADMTEEQILDAFSMGYNTGFEDGKKNEMIH